VQRKPKKPKLAKAAAQGYHDVYGTQVSVKVVICHCAVLTSLLLCGHACRHGQKYRCTPQVQSEFMMSKVFFSGCLLMA